MSTLALAMPTIFRHEGGLSDNTQDSGGITKYGISLKFLLSIGKDGDINHDGVIDEEDIKSLTPEQATHLYDKYWWRRYNYGLIEDQSIATKTLDLSINMGSSGAHKCLQRAVRAVSNVILIEDGVLGDKTLQVVNNCDPKLLLCAFRSEAAGYYRSIATNKDSVFLSGWLNRAYD